VREEAQLELSRARALLGSTATQATFTVLIGRPDAPLAAWAAEHEFDLVLLPFHRLTLRGHPQVRALRRATAAEVRLVR
jgi:hypothetical protein